MSGYHEAPDLAAQVAAGTLPAVEKRLPDAPVVTTADYAVVGKYGGTLHTASWWPEVGNVQLYFAVEAPIKWKADLTGYEPGLVESYEWSADGKTFTMHMRPGLKWSDGEPYTTADWKFWWEDIAKNPDQKKWTIPAYLRNADGSPIDMTFPDDYTVVWTAKDRPLWIDPYFMAQGYWEFAQNFMKPAHFLNQPVGVLVGITAMIERLRIRAGIQGFQLIGCHACHPKFSSYEARARPARIP